MLRYVSCDEILASGAPPTPKLMSDEVAFDWPTAPATEWKPDFAGSNYNVL